MPVTKSNLGGQLLAMMEHEGGSIGAVFVNNNNNNNNNNYNYNSNGLAFLKMFSFYCHFVIFCP